MVRNGMIKEDQFMRIAESQSSRDRISSNMRTKEDVQAYIRSLGGDDSLVIVLDGIWKSPWIRKAIYKDIQPNPFLSKTTEYLLEKQGWSSNEYLAVQWRTEGATGNLTDCYHQIVRPSIEVMRMKNNLKAHQVFVNTDLAGGSSGTYHSYYHRQERKVILESIEDRYGASPLAEFINQIEDSGIKAMVSGLVSANARVMLASSLAKVMSTEVALDKESACQKPTSKYITLVQEWRVEVLGRSPETVVRLFPHEKRFPEDEKGET
ncbi:unnamed protein product [Choristocarpus tenellus]